MYWRVGLEKRPTFKKHPNKVFAGCHDGLIEEEAAPLVDWRCLVLLAEVCKLRMNEVIASLIQLLFNFQCDVCNSFN